MLTIDKLIIQTSKDLQKAGIICAKLEAKILIAHITSLSVSDVMFCHREITSKEEACLKSYIQRRTSGEPICNIIGSKGFYKYNFLVNENVLSPRPDTEILLEESIHIAKNISSPKILELGVGSGCIILSLLSEIKSSTGIGVDVSSEALKISSKNADKLDVSTRCRLINASWFDEDIINKIGDEFDIIVTNPPYIPTQDIKTLDKEVRLYDPMLALDGGEDGLNHYKQIAKIAPHLLKNGGYIFIEAGINQAQDISLIFEREGLHLVSIVKDLQNIDRCVILKK